MGRSRKELAGTEVDASYDDLKGFPKGEEPLRMNGRGVLASSVVV
jgi:hypothetical protein